MKLNLILPFRAAILGLLLLSIGARAEEIVLEGNAQVVVERNVAMVTRDGVTLRADIFRPKEPGKYPVILERTPYDKRAESFGPRAASKGYVFVTQDVRGRNASEGEWYPMKNEANDGYDAVEWVAALPYANGKVGMFGSSYVGATQMLAAIAAPPHLVGIMPAFTASNYHEQWVYQGGAFSQALNQGWSTALSLNVLERHAGRTAQPSHWDMKRPPATYPMLEVPTGAELADYYYDWLKHPDYDDYWKKMSLEAHFDQVKVPALHVGAWFDIFEEGNVQSFLGIRSHGGSEAARHGQRLMMAVGGHAGAGPKVGEVDYGPDSVVDLWALTFRWYDYLLKGVDNGMAAEKPVRLFVMGRNSWSDEDDWPSPRSKPFRYFLHSGGHANSAAGDGGLAPAAPAAEPEDRFVYDPADPVATVGGPAFGDVHLKQGPYDQRENEKRADVLVYTTPAFGRDTELNGPVALELFVSSSAVDTDITGKLVDVSPDGTARNLAEGILRLRYRDSREKSTLMHPGEIYRVTVDLGAIAQVFPAGHRLRVEVAGSNFPRFDRNLNTGAEIGSTSAESVKATNRVLHDREHPSALVVRQVP